MDYKLELNNVCSYINTAIYKNTSITKEINRDSYNIIIHLDYLLPDNHIRDFCINFYEILKHEIDTITQENIKELSKHEKSIEKCDDEIENIVQL